MINYLKNGFSKNKNIENLEIKIVNKEIVHDKKNWSAYIISISGDDVIGRERRRFSQHSLYFSDGILVTPDLRNAITDERYRETMAPKFNEKNYDEIYHIFGNKNAKHKVAIFSDPLCPSCIEYIPKVLDILKKEPSKYCVYYYHFPLDMHPTSKTLVKAYMVLEEKKTSNLNIKKLYNIKISEDELNEKEILSAFNKVFHSKVTIKDINSKKILDHYASTLKISEYLMVRGTPALYYNGEEDSIERFLK